MPEFGLTGAWTPNDPVTQPSVVSIDGHSFVAIPANANHAWEPQYGTFASFWFAGSIAPGEHYESDAAMTGDLVFYAPAGPDGNAPISGVALVTNDGATVLGWAPVSGWGPIAEPKDF